MKKYRVYMDDSACEDGSDFVLTNSRGKTLAIKRFVNFYSDENEEEKQNVFNSMNEEDFAYYGVNLDYKYFSETKYDEEPIVHTYLGILKYPNKKFRHMGMECCGEGGDPIEAEDDESAVQKFLDTNPFVEYAFPEDDSEE